MYRSLAGVLAIAFVMVGRADEIEKAESKVAKVREEHAAALTKIRDDVKKMIEAKEKKETDKKGKADLAVLAALQAEKEALVTKGELPNWVDLKTRDQISNAHKPLVNALLDLKGVHVQLKDFKKAAEVEKQIEDLKKPSGLAGSILPAKNDLLGVGSVWVGQITFVDALKPASSRGVPYEMRVMELKGNEITLQSTQFNNNGKTKTTELKGTINGGKIELKPTRVLDKTEFFPGVYSGDLSGDSIKLNYKLDKGTSGTIDVKLKAGKDKK